MNFGKDDSSYSSTTDTTSLDSIVNQLFSPSNIQTFRESCPVTVVTHSIMGFAFGSFMGLFLSSFSPEMSMLNPSAVAPQQANLTTAQSVKQTFKEMGRKTLSSGKNFAIIGALFSASECTLESIRARKDLYNTAASGCFAGAIIARKSGPKAALASCAGFAAFSTAIEYFLQDR